MRAAARSLPAVVDIDVRPAVIIESLGHERLRRLEHFLLADGIAPAIPTVPAHRRRERDFVADDDAKIAVGFSGGVGGVDRDVIFRRRLDRAGDLSGRGVKRQPGGQAIAEKVMGRSPVAVMV